MSSFVRTILVLAGALALVCISSRAQPAVDNNSSLPMKSPVALFRNLLAMNPAQRGEAIALRPPDIQKRILEKLNEYEILPGELRELRLRETELRWYLRPLMDEPRTNRAALLTRIPDELRTEVQARLEQWDLLPPTLQDQFKDNDLIASYFAQISMATPEEAAAILSTIPTDRRAVLEKGLEHWKEMSEGDRQKTLAAFNKWFELTPEQKEKTLDTVSEQERHEMEQTLSTYANLTLDQRAQCIKSFEKFAGMSIAERQQFLKNAERWREMTPEERQKWRELVSVAPIMPPPNFPRPRPYPARVQQLSLPGLATN
jgi:hypothetical protein